MLFTEAGPRAGDPAQGRALHAGRFARAGIQHVADLGCGIGGDALALAAIDLEVTAAEADEVTAAIAAYNLAVPPRVRVLHARAEDVPSAASTAPGSTRPGAPPPGGTTRRLSDAAEYSPSLDFAFGLAERMPVGVKLGPGTDRDVIPAGPRPSGSRSTATSSSSPSGWARSRPGVGRAALVIRGDGARAHAPADSEDAPVGPLGDYLYEPDGAVIRARLIGDLARANGAWMLSHGHRLPHRRPAFESPFARGFRVLERLPADERQLRQALAGRGIGTLEIKKRGVDVDPAALRTRLKLRGDESATIVLTREEGGTWPSSSSGSTRSAGRPIGVVARRSRERAEDDRVVADPDGDEHETGDARCRCRRTRGSPLLLAAQAEHAEHDGRDRERQHPADEERRRGADHADDRGDPAVDPPLRVLLVGSASTRSSSGRCTTSSWPVGTDRSSPVSNGTSNSRTAGSARSVGSVGGTGRAGLRRRGRARPRSARTTRARGSGGAASPSARRPRERSGDSPVGRGPLAIGHHAPQYV